MPDATLFAGIPAANPNLFRRLGIGPGDPAGWLKIDARTIGIVRDIESERAQGAGRCDQITSPGNHPPAGGLSSDRETATAQAIAQLLVSEDVKMVVVDRSLPFIYAHHLMQREIQVRYDEDLGVVDRRSKTQEEIQWLRQAQEMTESGMRMICEKIAAADIDDSGQLRDADGPLTSEGLRALAAAYFIDRGYSCGHGAIVATAPHAGDCHHSGTGTLRTGVPVIVDLFPRNEATRYWGDCTRTVVHGKPSETVTRMHASIVAAKRAACDVLHTGNTADAVHAEVIRVHTENGFPQSRGTVTDHPSVQHGTGHGIGLELHEPILLDENGPEVLRGEVFTVEPGLYGKNDGGVRVEDMLVVHDDHAENLNQLHEGLDWN
ncbi:MAG: M24 family metallopeptidase [Planctomycetota bacterium]